MATVIQMQDSLTAEVVSDDYDDVISGLQNASQKGQGFLALDNTEGERIAIFIPNILTIKEHLE